MEPNILSSLVNFGVAGLIGWLWLAERKAAGERDRQLAEAHERLARQRQHVSVLLSVVTDNTRALASLEAAQRATVAAIERVLGEKGSRGRED